MAVNQKKPKIAIISSVGRTREIGKGNNLIWRISEDLKRFKSLTTGHVIVMGRKTYQSIGRPLPNRTNIVVTRNKDFSAEGVTVAHSLDQALELAREKEKETIFIIGGAEIYKEILPQVDELYLTVIDDSKEADSFFPDYNEFTEEISREDKEQDGLKYSWVTLTR